MTVLDLRPALLKEKARGRLYYKTDPHWNELGAYFAYREIILTLRQWFPKLQPVQLSDFIVVTTTEPGGGLARWLGMKEVLTEERIALRPKRPRLAKEVAGATAPQVREKIEVIFQEQYVTEAPQAAIPRGVMFRDSYAIALMSFLSEHFGRMTYFERGMFCFDRELVERERPQVVIQEIVEGSLLSKKLPEQSD